MNNFLIKSITVTNRESVKTLIDNVESYTSIDNIIKSLWNDSLCYIFYDGSYREVLKVHTVNKDSKDLGFCSYRVDLKIEVYSLLD